MLDIALIRTRPDFVKDGMLAVGEDPALIDRVLELDGRWRDLVTMSGELKAARNRQSKAISLMAAGAERDGWIKGMRAVGDQIKSLDAQAAAARESLDELMLRIPNIPHEDAPRGKDESENVVRRTVGEPPVFAFEPRPHWELGPALGILDFDRGVKLSGSRFYVLLREGAMLQRALINWMLNLHVREHGYTEAYPPYLVSGKCLVGTGNLPKFAENLYRDVEEDLWLIPTAEVPLTNLHREEILDAAELPKRYVAYTACFRREKMSAGKDVRGIKRGHQFDKVELMKYVRPEDSDAELAKLLEDAEDVPRRLGLPYRVVEMCTGDLSFVACRKFDIELWAAGCGEWLEVSSCSNFRDFQARRANIRYRPEEARPPAVGRGAAPALVHTLNGSGLALPRTLIAVLENGQQADGSVVVPEVLRPYMGGLEKIERR
jgi:seryl-tRNA synthetase